MKLKEYFSNYIILSYDESNDRIIVNSQKLGQTYISKYLLDTLRKNSRGSKG